MDDQPAFPSKFQRRTMWRALTGLAILVLGSLLVFLIWLSSTTLAYLQPVLVPLAVAGIIAYLLDPVVQFLQKKGLSRIRGIIVVFGGFTAFLGILFFFVGKELADQNNSSTDEEIKLIRPMSVESLTSNKNHKVWGWAVKRFFEKDVEATRQHLDSGRALTGIHKNEKWRIDPRSDHFKSGGEQADEQLESLLYSNWSEPVQIGEIKHAENAIALNNFSLTKGGNYLTRLGQITLGRLLDSSGKILGFFGVIIGFAMVPIYLYYFLKESNAIQAGWQDYVPLKASKFKTEVVTTLREVNGYLISFFRGQVLVAFIDGILVGIALFIYGLDYGLLIGLFMALLGIIPYLGNIICLIPACVIAYFQAYAAQTDGNPIWGLPAWGYAVGVAAIFVIVQQINSLVTAPKIVGDSVGLHPMTVIFSMLFWSLILGGFLGALLAVPLTAAVKVLFRRYIWDKQEMDGNRSLERA